MSADLPQVQQVIFLLRHLAQERVWCTLRFTLVAGKRGPQAFDCRRNVVRGGRNQRRGCRGKLKAGLHALGQQRILDQQVRIYH